MLLRLLLAITVTTILIAFIHYIRKQPPEKRKGLSIKYGLYALAIIAIALVVTGKLHWIAAAIAAIIPLGQKLVLLAMRFLPMLRFWQSFKQQQGNQQDHQQQRQSSTHNSGNMSKAQAMEILGLKELNSIEEVTKRHRELMQKMHPDRGGSDFLAAQINQAKDVLIDHLKR